jgi:hypothetical protein
MCWPNEWLQQWTLTLTADTDTGSDCSPKKLIKKPIKGTYKTYKRNPVDSMKPIKGTAKYRNPCYTSSIVTIQFRSPRVTISDAPPAVPVRWRWGATVERPRRSGKRQSSMETDRHNHEKCSNAIYIYTQQKYVDIHWYMCVYHGILSHILCGYLHNH